MIYQNKPLIIRILFENLAKHPVKGISRPQAYIKESGNYSSILRFNLLGKEVRHKQQEVFETILESPAGFGAYLKEGALLTIKNGLDTIGKGIVVEIIGYLDAP